MSLPFALLLMSQLAVPEQGELTADALEYDGARQVVRARGHVELRASGMVVRSDELTWHQDSGSVRAEGRVRLFAFPWVGIAEAAEVSPRTGAAQLFHGRFLKKSGVSELELLATSGPAELERSGQNPLQLQGERLRKLPDGSFDVSGIDFTPCDCDGAALSWKLSASSANVLPGERALLTWPKFHVGDVPVFALPALYVPLSNRRTGFLFPRPLTSPLNGVGVEQPFFLTLGESADATFTAGYFGGNDRSVFGVRGPRLQTEFRYTPSASTQGRATLGLLYDSRTDRDPLNPQLAAGGPGAPRVRGLRAEGSLTHVQSLGGAWHDRVDAAVVSDGYYPRDLTADILARENQYLRSTGSLFRRGDDSWLGLDVQLRQGIVQGFHLLQRDYLSDGTQLSAPPLLQRLPALTLSVPEAVLKGPFAGSVRASLVRIAPLSGGGDALRPSRTRLDLHPQLAASGAVGRFLTARAFAGYRQDLYLGEAAGTAAQRGYPLLGMSVATALSRDFGARPSGLRHVVRPELRLQGVPFVSGALPGVAYDEVDSALPAATQRLWQGVGVVRQQLFWRRGAAVSELARLDLGQGVDLVESRPADAFARLAFGNGGLRLEGVARYDVSRRRLSQLAASFNAADGQGRALFVGYNALRLTGTDAQRRGIDELVGLPSAPDAALAEQVTGGLRVPLPWGLGVRYELVASPRTPSPLPPEGASVLRQQLFGASWSPACDCWRLEGQAVVRPGQNVELGLNFVIHHFGGAGS